jgi:NADH-quinone oxidoreductase subunit L
MIFIYSVGYHNYGAARHRRGVPNHGKEEPMFSRFFALMSLFAGAMLLLVVADNLLLLFIGWEIMGFCSYSLIGFWYARNYHLAPTHPPHPPRAAAIKAFMTTRVADVSCFWALSTSTAPLARSTLAKRSAPSLEMPPWKLAWARWA